MAGTSARTRSAWLIGIALVLAGCSSAADSGPTTRVTTTVGSVGAGEGALTVIARPGYVEDGTNDPGQDWVHPFEKATGCTVTSKVAANPDQLAEFLAAGDYDVVSAAGDISLGLILGGAVQPINIGLVPNYRTMFPFLSDQPWNSKDGLTYGIPVGWTANLLMSVSPAVKSAPTSWSSVFDPKSPSKGKIAAYDSPITIADAALYLAHAQPQLGIKSPFALDQRQLDAVVDLLRKQRPILGQYWTQDTTMVRGFESGDYVLGSGRQDIADLLTADKVKVTATVPREGTTAWSDNWMISAEAAHPNCAYKWLDWTGSAEVDAQLAKWTGQAPAQTASCQQPGMAEHCERYHALDENYLKALSWWTTPTAQCLDGRADTTCVDYAGWTKAWQSIKGPATG